MQAHFSTAAAARPVRRYAPAALVALCPLRPHELPAQLVGLLQRNRLALQQLDIAQQDIQTRGGFEALASLTIDRFRSAQFTRLADQLLLACGPLGVDLGQLAFDR